ncbi:MAG TPA: hypothetical protein VEJ41_09805 [Candidatus Acidoferrales bacterium]|nr:hypothetical protein [Candidatus Acidoferrales bacterium]
MRTRILFAILASVAIAGCSGGGSSLPGATGPNSGSTTQSISKQDVAQGATEAAFDPVEAGTLDAGLFNGNMGVALTATSSPQSTGTCKNGIEHTVTIISSNQTQYETKYFYDNACTYLARDVVSLVTLNSSSSESVVRTAKDYNLAGTLLSTRDTNYAITGAPGNFSAVVTSDVYIGTSTSPTILFGRQFTVAPQSSMVYTMAANSGRVVNNANLNHSYGHMGVLSNGTITLDGSGDVTFAGSHAGTFIRGPMGSLTLSSAPPFTVSGGTVLGTTNVSGSVEFDSNCDIVSVDVSGTLWNGDSIVVTSSGTPPTVSINGSITTSSGDPVATFTVDQYGDGVITYADGSQGLIIDWHLVR